MKRKYGSGFIYSWPVLLFLVLFFLCGSAFGDVLIDDGDSGTSFTGAWYPSGGTLPYDGDSLASRDGVTYSWQMNSQLPGTYEVLMWWSAYKSRATKIPVAIYHANGTENLSVNQQENAGQWNSLGTYFFNGSGTVTITAAYGATLSTCADAVWYRFISGNTPPTASIDMIDPNPAEPQQIIEFQGSGADTEGDIAAYRWESSIDGLLSDVASFTTSLTEGTHIISFSVQDAEGLWSVPATQTLIVGSVPTEIIIDNRAAGTSQTGTWEVSGASNPYGPDSVWSRDGTTFTWNFTPPQTGEYELTMWWTVWPSRSTSVPVTIQYDGGSETININQQQNGGKWNSLGVYRFDTNSGGKVSIKSQPYPSSTCADAVKFNFMETNSTPTANIDSISPNPADAGQEVTFTGHGEDTDGSVSAYAWKSSIDGELSDQPSFSSAGLSNGVHAITFRVQDDAGAWSVPAEASLSVGNIPPTAYIDSISPNPANLDALIVFSGHGEDPDGTVTGYSWDSDIDGHLSDFSSFSTNVLSKGTHTITFVVYDEDGAASQPVTQSLTIDEIPEEIVIDNGGAGTSYTGAWYVSGASGYYGTNSLWSRDGATYTWTFQPVVSDHYEIFMWWTEWPSRSMSVPVKIAYAGGSTTVLVNQQANGGKWNTLGDYLFEANTSYRITITAQPGPSSTCADAMKFTRVAQASPPVADFSADSVYGGAPYTIQFTDMSLGNVTDWLWNFGDGNTSTEENPVHEYLEPGDYTVSLTVENSSGSDTETRQNYIHILAAAENIYLCDGYAGDALFIPHTTQMLTSMGAVENNGVYVYTNTDKNITYFIHTVRTPAAMDAALKEQDSHIVINGHANFGLGLTFATVSEVYRQQIDNIYFIDDERFMSFSTDMVSVKIDGMQYGQAYPNWLPIYSDYSSGIMPYTFDEGTPPYNYYLKYEIPGDPNTYKVELSNGSYLERFPDANVPAWDWPNGSAPPDPMANPEYFITNTDSDFNRFDVVGNWPMAKVAGAGYMGEAGYLGYNYQYHLPGTGQNTATFTLLVKYPGYYAALASWYPDPANATNAKFTIQHAGGSSIVEVDQRETQLANTLGAFYFDEGAYTFQVSDDADGTVIADAFILKRPGESGKDSPIRIQSRRDIGRRSPGGPVCPDGLFLFHVGCLRRNYGLVLGFRRWDLQHPGEPDPHLCESRALHRKSQGNRFIRGTRYRGQDRFYRGWDIALDPGGIHVPEPIGLRSNSRGFYRSKRRGNYKLGVGFRRRIPGQHRA